MPTGKKKEKYTDGMDMSKLEHLKEISFYDHNFYKGIDGDLLYALSDDDNETEWFVFNYFSAAFSLLGYSYVSNGEKLVKTNERHT